MQGFSRNRGYVDESWMISILAVYECYQGCADRGHVGPMPPTILSNLQESWSEVSHAAEELATVFSVTFLLVKIVG